MHEALYLRRQAVAFLKIEEFAEPQENYAVVRAAQIDRRTHERPQDGRQIERRAADDLQHIGGGGLLFQRLLGLVEEAHIVDRDRRLIGERPEQAHIFLSEGPDPLARRRYQADHAAFGQHRYGQGGAKTAHARVFAPFRIWTGLAVGIIDRALVEDTAPIKSIGVRALRK